MNPMKKRAGSAEGHRPGQRTFSLFLCLVMALSALAAVLPVTAACAYDGNPYAVLEKTMTAVRFNDMDWYLIEDNSTAADAGTVTLLAKEFIGFSAFDENGRSNVYSGSTLEKTVNDYYRDHFSSVSHAVADRRLFILTREQAETLSWEMRKYNQYDDTFMNDWWLSSPTDSPAYAACILGMTGCNDLVAYVGDKNGVRPAVKVDLAFTVFSPETNVFTVKPADPVLRIGYQFEDGSQAAAPYENSFAPGSAYSVPSPEVEGFMPDKPVVEGTIGSGDITVTVVYSLVKKPDISSAAVGAISDQEYTGKAIRPAPAVEMDGRLLEEGTDYTVKYRNNGDVGKATVVITGTGDYTGTKTVSFRIVPKKVASPLLKAGKKSLTVKWKAGRGIDGYEIEYSLTDDFSGSKKVTVKKSGTEKYTIKKLTSGSTYCVRIRAFRKVRGKKYYSAWSKVLSRKVK